ncbi:MAG TPA: hypothetical protein DCE56_35120 [Cyanobacteria bacterium UBA8553]|nr:hypothetical protein [Cyanobacteria bacterium UBA8553]
MGGKAQVFLGNCTEITTRCCYILFLINSGLTPMADFNPTASGEGYSDDPTCSGWLEILLL